MMAKSKLTHAAFYALAYPDLREHFGPRLLLLDLQQTIEQDEHCYSFLVEFRDVHEPEQVWGVRLKRRGTLTDELVEGFARIVARQAINLEKVQQGMTPPLPLPESTPEESLS